MKQSVLRSAIFNRKEVFVFPFLSRSLSIHTLGWLIQASLPSRLGKHIKVSL